MIWIIIFLLVFISFIYGLNYYFYNKISKFLFDFKKIWLVSLASTLIIFILTFLSRFSQDSFMFYLLHLIYYFLGMLTMFFTTFIFYDLIKLMFRKNNKFNKNIKYFQKVFLVFFVFIFLFSIYEFEKPISVNEVFIESDKVSKDYVFLHITDTQYGSTGDPHLKRIRELANKIILEENVDYILFTGDMIDTDNFEKEDLQSLFNFSIPVYFSLGNHEYYHNMNKTLDILESEYILLRNETYEFEDLRIIGIDDGEDKLIVRDELSFMNLSNDKFNLLIYHRPVGVQDAKNLGIDLMVTGHTHGGQFFPFNLLLPLSFDFGQGEVRLDEFVLYTSDGAGLWGPKLRLGTENEITLFYIQSK